MKYFYSEIDEITLTFGDIHLNRSGIEYIKIYFERPNKNAATASLSLNTIWTLLKAQII